MEKNIERRAELTGKLIVMSEALMKEGFESDDKQIISAGSLLMMIGTLIMNENEMEEFNKLTSMFTSNKILGMFEEKGIDIAKYLLPSGDGDDSFESIMERIRKDIENNFNDKKDDGKNE
jgi:hypothetical protein